MGIDVDTVHQLIQKYRNKENVYVYWEDVYYYDDESGNPYYETDMRLSLTLPRDDDYIILRNKNYSPIFTGYPDALVDWINESTTLSYSVERGNVHFKRIYIRDPELDKYILKKS